MLNRETRDTSEECEIEFRKYERYATEIYSIAHDKNWALAESCLRWALKLMLGPKLLRNSILEQQFESLQSHTHKEFHDFSILDLAAHGKCQNFLAHPGIWNKVNELWKRPRNGS